MGRPIALLSAFGAAFALYKRSYVAAAALALITAIALRSLEMSSPQVKSAPPLRKRSLSLPNLLTSKERSSLQSVEGVSSPSNFPKSIEAFPLPPPEEKEKRVDLNQLPMVKLSFWDLGVARPSSSRITIFNGYLREVGSSLLDWESLLGSGPLSLEVGHIYNGAKRTKEEGGRWIFMTSDWWAYRDVASSLDQLTLFGDPWFESGALPKRRFSRIDLRSPISRDLLRSRDIDDQTLSLFDLLEEGGEFRSISDYSDLSFQLQCQERLGVPDRLLVVPGSYPKLHQIYGRGGEERAQTELVKLSQLPEKKRYFWWVHDPFPTSLEIVNGVVDLRANPSVSLDWDELFPKGELLSLELGEVFDAVRRTQNRGGHWVVMTNWPQTALNVERARQGGVTQPLILFGNHWSYPSFLPNCRFKRIDLRFPSHVISGHQIARFAEALGEGGELRFIFDEGEPKIDDYRIKMERSDRFNFLRSEAVEETIVLLDLPLLGRHRDTHQTHLIYRKVQ